MAKPVSSVVKLQIIWWRANPAPPVWTALWPTWIQIAEFCKQFNDQTKEKNWVTIPVEISIYDDRSFTFTMKEPPMTYLIKEELKLKSGSKEPHKIKVWHLSMDQLKKIAKSKMPDLNASKIESAMSIVAGSARSMWITSDLKK